MHVVGSGLIAANSSGFVKTYADGERVHHAKAKQVVVYLRNCADRKRFVRF